MTSHPMDPLAQFPASALCAVQTVLTDIDDTLTHDGQMPAASMMALERLAAAGLRIIPVTGRPAGWCDMIARFWPVSAVIGENGAFYYAYDRAARQMRRVYAKSAAERAADRQRLDTLCQQVLAAVPGAALASDQAYRVADIAIDFCEDVAPLAPAAIDTIVRILTAGGATCKVSSIHVNAWFGGYDKLTMTRQCLHEMWGIDMDQANKTIVFVGDSPNDAPMFGYFTHAVGVANVRKFRLEHEPAWVTTAESATGFLEVADALLTARGVITHES
jgi:HAD superfamily hydrolase (TIGR01484 family)